MLDLRGSFLKKMERLFNAFCNFVFVFAALAMGVVALGLVVSSLVKVYMAFSEMPVDQPILLDAVSLIVISIAIFDIARYVMEEEVLKDRELRDPREAREAITKFMVIVAFVVALEGIVFIFDLGKTNPEYLLYPILLLGVSILIVIGLGLYQRLSVETEREIEKENFEKKASNDSSNPYLASKNRLSSYKSS